MPILSQASRIARIGFIALLALIVSSGSVMADKYAAEFLRIGVGARALGMGGAFTALADDASAAYWNPAGLAGMGSPELLFMHAEQFGDLATHDFFGYVQPLSNVDSRSEGTIGFAAIRFGVDDIILTRDAFNDRNNNGRPDPGEVDTSLFRKGSDTEWGVLFSYARPVGDWGTLGGNLKVVRQALLRNTSFGMGVDLGLLITAWRHMILGVRLADITTTQISWDTGTREVVSPSITVGAQRSGKPPVLPGRAVAALDFGFGFDGRVEASQVGSGSVAGDLHMGVEYWPMDAVAVRVGNDAGDWVGGGGIRYRGLGADYAFLPHDDLGETHRLSASVRF